MKYIVFALAFLFIISSCEKDDNSGIVDISLSMGTDYANDIFYSLKEETVLNVSRTNWDIGFATYVMSPSIIINSGSGVELFLISRDTSDWYSPVDTSGISSLSKLNNSLETWDIGAFSGNMAGGFDFGWGIYAGQPTYNVNGASVYLIKLQNGTLKKIFIRQKNGYLNAVYFLYANTDGSDAKSVALANNPYAGKEYVYYSLSNNSIVDREPPKENWDLLFTKYFDSQINYIVTGVFTKSGVKVAEVTGVSPATADTTMAQFSSSLSVIGYDWKQFEMATNKYILLDDVSYFVKTTSNNVYQIYFTRFDGGTTGAIGFQKKLIK